MVCPREDLEITTLLLLQQAVENRDERVACGSRSSGHREYGQHFLQYDDGVVDVHELPGINTIDESLR